MAKAAKKAKSPKQERRERQFFPRATANTGLVGAIGAIGALAMGAGFWAQWGRVLFTSNEEALPFGWWLVAGGAVLVGVAIWIGTSGEPLLRVGDGGVGIERSGLFGALPIRRIPWHGVTSIGYEGASGAIVVRGHDETGAELTINATLKSHPQAAAWIVREARERIPATVGVGDEIALPEARSSAGEVLALDPLQVVGKRCTASGTIIAFEPDGRVCPRCERVYHKAHVPPTCECGASLGKTAAGDDASTAQPEASPG
jgi:hypothetical protein